MSDPEAFDSEVLTWFKEHTKWEIVKEAQELRLAFAPILTPGELADDEQIKAREYMSRVDHPIMGKVVCPGAPAKLSGTPGKQGKAPVLGEHNEEIYGELGYSREKLAELKGNGVI